MKFQIPSMHHSEVNRRTDRQTDKPKAICPSNFFKVGGIKILAYKPGVQQTDLAFVYDTCQTSHVEPMLICHNRRMHFRRILRFLKEIFRNHRVIFRKCQFSNDFVKTKDSRNFKMFNFFF